LKANPLGLYDIHGNAWEWVEDGWEPTYFVQIADKPAINPNGPASAGSLHVVRGGTWLHRASALRTSFRYSQKPTDRYSHIGFRVALPADGVRQALKKTKT
jgi:formylglycine-generating enzyme required for sulfatase activity